MVGIVGGKSDFSCSGLVVSCPVDLNIFGIGNLKKLDSFGVFRGIGATESSCPCGWLQVIYDCDLRDVRFLENELGNFGSWGDVVWGGG